MAAGIFWMFLILMTVVGVNQPFLSSEDSGIVSKDGEEILQRMKEREASLQLHQLHLEQEIADLEARQKVLGMPDLERKRKIQRHTFNILFLVILALIGLWRQH